MGRPVTQTAKIAVRWLLAIAYLAAGILHLMRPGPFLSIMPGWMPLPEAVVFWTGVAEIAGALALAQPFSKGARKAGAWGLAAYALCVFAANVNHFAIDMAKPGGGLGLAYHVPRMVAQPVIIALTLWAGGIIGRAERR